MAPPRLHLNREIEILIFSILSSKFFSISNNFGLHLRLFFGCFFDSNGGAEVSIILAIIGMKIEVKITITDASLVFVCHIFSSYSHIEMNK